MKVPLINVSLQRYGTRMLTAGDQFEANRRDARVLVALKKAQPDDGTQAAAAEALAKARADYQAKFGKRPFNGWGADEINAKIAAGTDPAAS